VGTKIDYRSPAVYATDLSRAGWSNPVERPRDFAAAVRLAITRYKDGDVPVVIGEDVHLVGIEPIKAVRRLKDFPAD
jgi:hypothetical protein